MSRLTSLIEAIPDPPWGEPDAYDTAGASEISRDFGRFACSLCAQNRDDADRLERELADAQRQLARAQALLKVLGRVQQKPAPREGDETPHELALIGFATALAAVRARIEIYFQSVRAGQ
jgi:hypothetical protein